MGVIKCEIHGRKPIVLLEEKLHGKVKMQKRVEGILRVQIFFEPDISGVFFMTLETFQDSFDSKVESKIVEILDNMKPYCLVCFQSYMETNSIEIIEKQISYNFQSD